MSRARSLSRSWFELNDGRKHDSFIRGWASVEGLPPSRAPHWAMNCNHLNFGMTRRDFFGRFAFGLGGAALAGMFQPSGMASKLANAASPYQGLPDFPNFAPRAR